MGVTQTREAPPPSVVDTLEEEEDLILYRFKNINNVNIDNRTTSIVLTDSLPVQFFNLNQGDVFVLDVSTLNTIYVWVGNESHPREKTKALYMAHKINEDMGNSSRVVVLHSRNFLSQEAVGFWNQFNLKTNSSIRTALTQVEPASSFPDDQVLRNRIYESKLFKLGEDEEDRPFITIVGASQPLSKEWMDSSSSFVLDIHNSINVYIWTGKYASMSSRSMAILKTEEIIGRDLRDKGIERKLQWNMDDIELWDFKEMFFDWMDINWDPAEVERLEALKRNQAEMLKQMEQETLSMDDFYNLGDTDSSPPDDTPKVIEEEEPYQQPKYIQPVVDDSPPEHIENKIKPLKIKRRSETVEEPPVSVNEKVESPVVSEKLKIEEIKEVEKIEEIKRVAKVEEVKKEEEVISKAKDPDTPIKEVPRKRFGVKPIKNLTPEVTEEVLSPEKKLEIDIKAFSSAIPSSKSLPKGWTDSIDSLKSQDAIIELAVEETRTQALDFVEKKEPVKVVETPKSAQKPERKRGHRRNLSAYIVEQPEPTHLLANPVKTAAPTNRRKPTRNLARNMSSKKSETDTASEVRRANIGGSYGLLRALGADLNLLQKKPKAKTPTLSQKGDPRLIQIKGRRKMIVRQVRPCVDSLNSGDVFILDTGKSKLYQWNGKESNRIEKGKAMDVIKNIKDKELSGLAQVVVLDEGVNDTNPNDDFWKILEPGSVQPAQDAGSDLDIDSFLKKSSNLYQVVQAGDSVESELLATYPIKKELLEDNGCYILDCITEIYVWCGKTSKLNLRKNAIDIATHLSSIRDFWCAPISRELPGGESVLFREKFSNWGYGPPIQMQQLEVGKNVTKVDQEKIDVPQLYNNVATRHEVVVDDGSGSLRIWKVVGFEKEAVQPDLYGHFYEGDSYLVLYTYMLKNKEAYVIYYWQGRKSSINEKGASAMLTINLEKEFEMAKEIRVVQGYEPLHFLNVFKGKYIIHKGKATDALDKNSLYEVNGCHPEYTRVFQVDNVKSSFKSMRYVSCYQSLRHQPNHSFSVLSFLCNRVMFMYGKGLFHLKRLLSLHKRLPICFLHYTKLRMFFQLKNRMSLHQCGRELANLRQSMPNSRIFIDSVYSMQVNLQDNLGLLKFQVHSTKMILQSMIVIFLMS